MQISTYLYIKNLITILGTGKVGTALQNVFIHSGMEAQVLSSRSLDRSPLPHDDLYIIAVKDDAITSVAKQLSRYTSHNPLVVHTSGTTPSNVLAPYFKRFGVFYPLQTFTKGRPVNFKNLPICLYANDVTDLQLLENLAQKISDRIAVIDDHQRRILHLAAVFVNNFVNFLYHIGQQITEQNDLPFDLLLPLIHETAAKITPFPPAENQTGPAVRNDLQTIDQHLRLLDDIHPEWRSLYKSLTTAIQNQHKK